MDFTHYSCVSIVDFEQVIAGWEGLWNFKYPEISKNILIEQVEWELNSGKE